MVNNKTSDEAEESLLDAKTMDGPAMKWAPNDVLKCNPKAFMTYHVMMSGYDYLTPVGVTLGGVMGMISPIKKRIFPTMTTLQAAGTVGFMTGLAGMGCGLFLMNRIATSKEPKLPWNEEGIQTRVDGISHNFMVRVMDAGVAGGAATAGGIMLVMGGPTALGLSTGALGVAQGVSLGSALGSISAIGCISATKGKTAGGGKEAIY